MEWNVERVFPPRTCVVLPAAGTGERMGSTTPKQFSFIHGRPLVSYTLEAFERISWISAVILSISADKMEYMQNVLTEFSHKRVFLIEGAITRHRSIYNGVKAVAEVCPEVEVVVVHDAVRPFVDEETVSAVVRAAQKDGAAGAVRPLVSTVVATDAHGYLDHSLDRSRYRASEMPQAFRYDIIKTAYEKSTDYDFDYGTECLHLAQLYTGTKVRLIDGPDNLWKVTYRKDLFAAESLLKASVSQVTVVFKDGMESPSLVSGIKQALHTRFRQDVCVITRLTMMDYLSTVEIPNATTSCSAAAVFVHCSVEGATELYTGDSDCNTISDSNIVSHCKVVIHVFLPGELDIDPYVQTVIKGFASQVPETLVVCGVVIKEQSDRSLDKACQIIASIIWHQEHAFKGQTFYAE